MEKADFKDFVQKEDELRRWTTLTMMQQKELHSWKEGQSKTKAPCQRSAPRPTFEQAHN
jgi:hypothetical protein